MPHFSEMKRAIKNLVVIYVKECFPFVFSKSFIGSGLTFRSLIHLSLFLYMVLAAAAAKSLQSCPTLCDPIDSGPPGSSVPGILQARTLEWIATSFSNA